MIDEGLYMSDKPIESAPVADPAPPKRRGRPKGSKNKQSNTEDKDVGARFADLNRLASRYTKWLKVDLVVADSLQTLGARISKEDIVAVSELPSGGCVVVVKAHGAPQPLVFNVATPFVKVEEDITTNEW